MPSDSSDTSKTDPSDEPPHKSRLDRFTAFLDNYYFRLVIGTLVAWGALATTASRKFSRFDAESTVVVVIAVLLFYTFLTMRRLPHITSRGEAITLIVYVLNYLVFYFATAYFVVSQSDRTAFSEPLGRMDALYYALATVTTTGFGDINARSQLARTVVSIQMVLGFVLIAYALTTAIAMRQATE